MGKNMINGFGFTIFQKAITMVIGLTLISFTFSATCDSRFLGKSEASGNSLPIYLPDAQTDGNTNPEISATDDDSPTPDAWVGDDFIISYDDAGYQDAKTPVIAVSPNVPTNPVWANSIHAVWSEFDELVGVSTIHYSMSQPEERGLEWSNDEASEGDRTISGLYNMRDASNPSIVIDEMGYIHLAWCQEYFPEAGFPTYEVHYSHSMDNGLTWAPEVPVSKWNHGGMDAPMPFFPKIEVSNNYMGQKILHVIWSEYSFDYTHSEIFYSTSMDGIIWSGINEDFSIRTNPTISAYDPDITVSGSGDQYVHIVWSQESPISGTSEVYYTRSMDAGTGGIWEQEKVVSNDQAGPTSLWIGIPKIATVGSSVFTIWDQPLTTDGASEICLSFSDSYGANDWSGTISTDTAISFNDGSSVDRGSLDIITDPTGAAYAMWTEYDESSPYGSSEIHFSMSHTPENPSSWTGHQRDIVLSSPDGEDGIAADALYPSVDIANFDGTWKPQIAWEELNAGGGRAQQNTEIHYLPDETFDIPVHLGWNLVSVPLIQENTSIFSVLDDGNGDGNTTWDLIKWYDPASPSDPWKTHRINGTANDISAIDNTMGIWIKITALGDGNLTVFGDYGTSTQISLRAGWNLVGYPAQTSKSITDSLGSIHDLPVEGYDSNSSYKISQLPGSYMMKPGEGYWVHVASDTVWTIDW